MQAVEPKIQILTPDRQSRKVAECELIELRCYYQNCGALLVRVSIDTRGVVEG